VRACVCVCVMFGGIDLLLPPGAYEPDCLPVAIRFLLQSMTADNARDVIADMRRNLDLEFVMQESVGFFLPLSSPSLSLFSKATCLLHL
jgi:hypothetical protein